MSVGQNADRRLFVRAGTNGPAINRANERPDQKIANRGRRKNAALINTPCDVGVCKIVRSLPAVYSGVDRSGYKDVLVEIPDNVGETDVGDFPSAESNGDNE